MKIEIEHDAMQPNVRQDLKPVVMKGSRSAAIAWRRRKKEF